MMTASSHIDRFVRAFALISTASTTRIGIPMQRTRAAG
jgi:hypothetical protein